MHAFLVKYYFLLFLFVLERLCLKYTIEKSCLLSLVIFHIFIFDSLRTNDIPL